MNGGGGHYEWGTESVNVWDCSNFGNVPLSGTLFFQDQPGAVVLSGPGTTPPNIKLRRGSPQVPILSILNEMDDTKWYWDMLK